MTEPIQAFSVTARIVRQKGAVWVTVDTSITLYTDISPGFLLHDSPFKEQIADDTAFV